MLFLASRSIFNAAVKVYKKYFDPSQANVHNMHRGFHKENKDGVKNLTEESRDDCAA